MGEAPHEVYTDAELKARADKVCGNCKWWKTESKSGGTCMSPEVIALARASIYLPTRQASTPDESVDVYLYTKPDFGCIHFEPKT